MNLKENYEQLKQQAYAGLQKRESSKGWIRMLEASPLLLGMTKGRLMLASYAGIRLLDDIADGDFQPPPGSSPITYLEDKQAFIRNPQNPQDNLDYLFLYCYQLSQKAGLDIHQELDAFFDYFLFDARRRKTGDVFTRAELDQAYHACDITGTIRLSLMLFGDDPNKVDLLMPLGRAVRKYYSLRDYEPDIAVGFVNIPSEAFEQFGIGIDDLTDRFNPSIRSWFHEEAVMGLQLLAEHEQNLRRERLKWRGKLVLPVAYSRPANAYFQAVLTDHDQRSPIGIS